MRAPITMNEIRRAIAMNDARGTERRLVAALAIMNPGEMYDPPLFIEVYGSDAYNAIELNRS